MPDTIGVLLGLYCLRSCIFIYTPILKCFSTGPKLWATKYWALFIALHWCRSLLDGSLLSQTHTHQHTDVWHIESSVFQYIGSWSQIAVYNFLQPNEKTRVSWSITQRGDVPLLNSHSASALFSQSLPILLMLPKQITIKQTPRIDLIYITREWTIVYP